MAFYIVSIKAAIESVTILETVEKELLAYSNLGPANINCITVVNSL